MGFTQGRGHATGGKELVVKIGRQYWTISEGCKEGSKPVVRVLQIYASFQGLVVKAERTGEVLDRGLLPHQHVMAQVLEIQDCSSVHLGTPVYPKHSMGGLLEQRSLVQLAMAIAQRIRW